MNAKNANTPKQNEPKQTQSNVEYVAPDDVTVETFAHGVCQQMNEKHGKAYADNDTVHEFTSFIKTVIRIKTKHLNNSRKVKKPDGK